jgi:quercetin dioxygenase-like cupin family protein
MNLTRIALPLVVTPFLVASAVAQSSGAAGRSESAHAIVATPNAITWAAAPDVLPPGAQAAVLEGDPSQPGPFTLRLAMPANYRIPPHFHPVTEHVTVLEGTFYVGMGETFDAEKASALPSGTFAALGPEVRHFAYTKGRTVIQLHGTGPWGLIYVNPADDPRKQTSK